jgi:molybdenum cofactor cytidylyltransferase
MTIAAIVLAAGASRRLGRPKQLVTYRGAPLLRAIVVEARASACDRVLVVLGANAEPIRPALAGLDVTVLTNDGWSEGIASSVRCGVRHAWDGDDRAAILLTCDQPELRAAHLDALIAAHRAGARVVASRYAGVLGVPALFDASLFPDLMVLEGDVGARTVIRDAAPAAAVEWPEGAEDVDTPEDLARASGAVSLAFTA